LPPWGGPTILCWARKCGDDKETKLDYSKIGGREGIATKGGGSAAVKDLENQGGATQEGDMGNIPWK